MLVKFDNGYFLEVLIEKDENGKEELEIVVEMIKEKLKP
jgi:hypothetical protein